jgi:hypothetical protein
MSFRSGDWVVVKSPEEILASVDGSGELESMPFMAEMLQYCGQRLQVSAVAHKTCDTIKKTGGRRVARAVHLKAIRCDGSAHGGCQAACLIFWKTEWLRPANGKSGDGPKGAAAPLLTADELRSRGSRIENGEVVYSCQATRLFAASSPLQWWDLRQYARDLWSGNVSIGRFLRASALRGVYHLRRLGIGYRAALALDDMAHKLLEGRGSPYKDGLIPAGELTPTETLNLVHGEWVEVKSHDEIRRTTTIENFNRGMLYGPEMVEYSGRRFRVDRRVERLIDERTGRMLAMKLPCIVLDGVVCTSDYSHRRLFCPRAIQPYFREIWLRRVSAEAHEGNDAD